MDELCPKALVFLFVFIAFTSRVFAYSNNVNLIGSWPFGSGTSVEISGLYCYLGVGSGIYVLDISKPTKPVKISELGLSGQVTDIKIKDNTLYALTEGRMLTQVIAVDITNPYSPSVIAYYTASSFVYEIFVYKNYLYLGYRWDRFDILDITTPKALTKIGEGEIEYAWNLHVYNDFAFVATGNTLTIFDVSNPSTPKKTGTYTSDSIKEGIADVFVDNNLAYIVGYHDYLEIIDVSNPSSPAKIGTTNIYGGNQIYIKGNYAYVLGWFSDFTIVDVSNPSNPTIAYRDTWLDGKDFKLNGDYAYIVNSASLDIVDIADPLTPAKVREFKTPDETRQVFVSGNYAYLAERYSGLYIIDITNSSAPKEIAHYQPYGDAKDIYVREGQAYLLSDSTLYILDVSNPLSIIEKGKVFLPYSPINMFISGDYAYVANGENGLCIVDISNPSSPNRISCLDTPDSAYDVFVNGNLAFVTTFYSGFSIIDVSKPASPALVTSYDTPGWAKGIFVKGNYAYVADGYLRIIDISNPEQPKETGYCCGGNDDVYVQGSYAYTAQTFSGINVVDIENPSNPTLVGYYELPATGEGVYADDKYIYAAEGSSGFYILDFVGSKELIHPSALSYITATAGDKRVSIDWFDADKGTYDIAGYNIYRTTTSGKDYVKINSSLITSTTYTDENVENGISYFYVVRVQDVMGNESANSGEASATPYLKDEKIIEAGLHLFSLPYILEIEDMSHFGIDKIARWEPSSADYIYHSNDPENEVLKLLPGSGYWIKLDKEKKLLLNALEKAQSEEDGFFHISLKAGWNQIGNPFNFNVNFSDISVRYQGEVKTLSDAADSGWIGKYAWAYPDQMTGYQLIHPTASGAKQVIEPWLGYWVNSAYDLEFLVPPIGASREREDTHTKSGGLSATIKVETENTKINFLIGRSTQKELIPKPPDPITNGSYAYLVKGSGQYLAEFNDSLEYEFVVSASQNQKIAISVYESKTLQDYLVYLTDLQTSKETNLSKSHYNYISDGMEKRFKLQITKAEKELFTQNLKLDEVIIYPNPIRNGANVAGAVNIIGKFSEGLPIYAEMEVYTLTGKLIRKDALAALYGGKGKVKLDTQNVEDSFLRLHNGIYIVRVTFYNVAGEKASKIVKISVVK